MTHYRCHVLNTADMIVSVDSVEAEDDTTGMLWAEGMIREKYGECAAIEVWERARCVGKILNFVPKRDLESLKT